MNTLNKKSSKSYFIIAVILIAGLLVGYGFFARRNLQTQSGQNAALLSTHETLSESKPGWQTYTNTVWGVKFSFPSDLFAFSNAGKNVSLMSPYHVVENYKGTPDGEFKHPFAISFEYQKLNVLDAIEQYPSFGDFMLQSFADGTLGSFESSESAGNAMIGGKNGYQFQFGIEGANTYFYFIPKSETETLVIKQTMFTDFLAQNVKPKPFSEKQEEDAFASVISTLKFLK